MNKNLKLALARYYMNRNNSKNGVKWDKQADLKHIDGIATAANYGIIAVAGTFWFTRKGRTIKCNESNYLNPIRELESEI